MSAAWYWPDWQATPPPPPPGQRCQHCQRDIRAAQYGDNGQVLFYEDSDGILVCQKRTSGGPYLTHQPMPVVTP